jgi:hypothetical protein
MILLIILPGGPVQPDTAHYPACGEAPGGGKAGGCGGSAAAVRNGCGRDGTKRICNGFISNLKTEGVMMHRDCSLALRFAN